MTVETVKTWKRRKMLRISYYTSNRLKEDDTLELVAALTRQILPHVRVFEVEETSTK